MKEIRNYGEINPIEDRTVEGYALVFNSESKDLGGFTEVIEPSALNGVLERSDIFCLLDHSKNRGVLARSKYGSGSLSLQVDDKGLKYRFKAPKTALGDELLEALERRDITSSSFAFQIKDDKWEKRSGGKYVRTITAFDQLFDVSPVYQPAYESTTVDKRGLEAIQKMEEGELKDYFTNLRKEFNK